jgi:hypothetical protein
LLTGRSYGLLAFTELGLKKILAEKVGKGCNEPVLKRQRSSEEVVKKLHLPELRTPFNYMKNIQKTKCPVSFLFQAIPVRYHERKDVDFYTV